MSETKKAYAAALIQVCIIGFSFMSVTIALQYVSPFDLLAYRFFFAWIASSIPLLFGKVKVQAKGRDFLNIFFLSLLYPILFFSFQAFGLQQATSVEGGIIQATTPLFTVLLARIFLKEKTTRVQRYFIFLSVGGVIYLSFAKQAGDVQFSFWGTILLGISAILMAFYNIFAHKLTRTYSFYTVTYFMTFCGFLVFLLLSASSRMLSGDSFDYLTPLKNSAFLLPVLYLGILSSFLTSLLNNYALSKLDASKVSIFSNLTPIIALAAGMFFLKEKISTQQLLGIVIILISVFGTNYFSKKSKSNK